MEHINYFNKDYFLLELQTAGAIKNNQENDSDSDSLTLKKVPNVTVGLVLAAKSLKIFENHIILNWIRKGRKVTELIEEQFDLYDKLSTYLQNNVHIEDDIKEWTQMLNNAKYVFPEKEKRGWSQIFGNTPKMLDKVNPEDVSHAYVVQQQIETSDTEDEALTQDNVEGETKVKDEPCETSDTEDESINQENEGDTKVKDELCETKASISKVHFSHKYFVSLLQEVGAITNDIEKDIPFYLQKVQSITIELVLAAKAANFFTDEEILTWIKKGRKLTPLMEEQFLLYKQLSSYLMNYVEPKDIEIWKSLIDSKYIFPSSGKEGWALIFGEVPELCHKIDKAQKSCKQLENPNTEFKADTMEEIKPSKECVISGPKLASTTLGDGVVECEETVETLKDIKNNEPELSSNSLEVSPQHESKEDNKATQNELTVFLDDDSSEIKYIDKSDTEIFNLSEIENSLELSDDKMLQSDSEDDLDDIFNAVGGELNAAEENEAEEHNSDNIVDIDDNVLELEAVEDELLGFLEAELGAAEVETTDTKSDCKELSEDSKGNKSKKVDENCITSPQKTTEDGSKTMFEKFETVIIFADKVYKPFFELMEFNDDYQKVWVAADDDLTPENLKTLVPKYCKLVKGSKRQLCILVTGLFNFAPLRNMKDLPLPELPAIGDLVFDFDKFSKKMPNTHDDEVIVNHIKELIVRGWKFQRYVKNHMNPNAVVVLVPPLPGLITQYGSEYASKVKFLRQCYEKFCSRWTWYCGEMFSMYELRTKKIGSMLRRYADYAKHFSWLNFPADIEYIKVKLNDWFELIKQILDIDYKANLPSRYCVKYNKNAKGELVNKVNCKCNKAHRCSNCGQGGHGKSRCFLFDNSICLKYNWAKCNNVTCNLRHVCYACEQDHVVLNCNVNFMQHLGTFQMTQNNTFRMVNYKRVVLVGNQFALSPFISSRIPELKIIANIKQLDVDVNLDCDESYIHALSKMQGHMVQHPEFTSDTLWILTADMTNWLHSDSLCRSHFSDKIDLCTEEIKMFYLKYDLPTRFYKAEEFVKCTLPYLGQNSAFILTPFIGQIVLCPPPICPSAYPSGLEKFDLNLSEFHNLVHKSPSLQNLQIYPPGVNKDDISKHLATFEQHWFDSVMRIMIMQGIPLKVLDKYRRYKKPEPDFQVLEDINLYPCPSSYSYWDAFMVILIKYLCDPLADEMELMCEFAKKSYTIRNEHGLTKKLDIRTKDEVAENAGEAATFEYWCKPCKLSGTKKNEVFIAAHMQSEKHRARVELLEKLKTTDCIDYDEVTGIIKCKVCNAYLKSPKHLADHLTSTTHILLMSGSSFHSRYSDVKVEHKGNSTQAPTPEPHIPKCLKQPKSGPTPEELQIHEIMGFGSFLSNKGKPLEKEKKITNQEIKKKEKNDENKLEKVSLDPKGLTTSIENNNIQQKSEKIDHLSLHTDTPKQSHESSKQKKSESEPKSHPKENSKTKAIEDAKKKIFVYNLPKNLKSEDLDEILKACGDIQEFEREVFDNVKAALCSVKFKNAHSVYRANRLINGRNICGKKLSVVIPMPDSFTEEEKEETARLDKQALERINEILNKLEKDKKRLRGNLKSATMENESRSQSKKEVGKEEIGKVESVIEAKKTEEIVEKKLKEAFDLKAADDQVTEDDKEQVIVTNNDDSFKNTKDAKDRAGDIKNNNTEISKKDDETRRSRSPSIEEVFRSRSEDSNDSSQKNYNQDGKKIIKDEYSKDKNVDPQRRKRSRSKDRKESTSSSSKKEETRNTDVKGGKYSENSRSPRRTRSRSRDRVKRSRNRDIDSYKSDDSEKSANDSDDSDDDDGRKKRSSRFKSERFEFKTLSKDKKSSVRIPGMCFAYNKSGGRCNTQKCNRPHKCFQCGGGHPNYKCLKGPLVCDECGGNHLTTRCQKRKERLAKEKDDSKNSANDSDDDNDDDDGKKKSRSRFESERFQTSSEDKKSNKITGMCSAYNDSRSTCTKEKCELPHKCDECGGGHPIFKCFKRKHRLAKEKGKEHESKRKECESKSKHLTPVQKGRSRSPRRSSKNRSRRSSRNRSRSPRRSSKNRSRRSSKNRSRRSSRNRSRSPRRSSMNRSRSHSKSRSPVHRRSRWSKIDESSSRKPLQPTPPPPPPPILSNRDPYNQLGLITNPAMFGLASPGTSKDYPTLPEMRSYDHLHQSINQFKMSNTMSNTAPVSSSNIPGYRMNVSQSSSSDRSLLYGIDVEKTARDTLNRDTSYIIAHIKNDLENLGTTPTKEIVGKLALEVSVRHFKMNADKESFSDDYGHGLSSSSLNKKPISIDYGHGAAKGKGDIWSQWTNDTLGQVSGTQGWPQSQSHSMAQMLPEGQTSLRLHDSIQGQEFNQGRGNSGGRWFQGHINERL